MRKKMSMYVVKWIFLLAIVTGLITACKDYDDDIDNLQNQVNEVKGILSSLQSSVGDKAVKSVVYDEASNSIIVTTFDGAVSTLKLSESVAEAPEIYSISVDATTDADNYIIKLTGNKGTVSTATIAKTQPVNAYDASKFTVVGGVLYVDGKSTGIAIPVAFTYDASKYTVVGGILYVDGKSTGITIPAAFTYDASKFTLDSDGYIVVDGQKTSIQMPEAIIGEQGATITYIKRKIGNEDVIYGIKIKVGSEEITLNVTPESVLVNLQFETTYSDLNTAEVPYFLNGLPTVSFYSLLSEAGGKIPVGASKFVSFRFSPSYVDLSKVEWSFLNSTAKVEMRAANDKNNLVSIVNSKPAKIAADEAIFEVKVDATKTQANAANNIYDIIQLKAVAPVSVVSTDKHDIVSEKIQLRIAEVVAAIGDLPKFEAAKDPTHANWITKYAYTKDAGLATLKDDATIADHQVAFQTGDGGVATYDLNDYVFSIANEKGDTYFDSLPGFGFNDFSYEFSSVSYKPIDETDQAFFVALNGSKFTINEATAYASIGRKPIFKAVLKSGNNVLATHYIKFEIVSVMRNPITVTLPKQTIEYIDLYKANTPEVELSWQEVNTKIYQALKLQHAQFAGLYSDPVNADIVYDHETASGSIKADKGSVDSKIATAGATTTETVGLSFNVDPETRFGEHSWSVVIKSTDPQLYPDVTIVFPFEIKKPTDLPRPNPAYVDNNGVANVKGKIVGSNFKLQTSLHESLIIDGANEYAGKFINKFEAAKAGSVKYSFKFANNTAIATESNIDAAIVDNAAGIVAPFDYKNLDIALQEPLNITNVTYGVKFVATYENGEVSEYAWKINFENPLAVSLKDFSLDTKEEAVTKKLADNLSVGVKITGGTASIINNGTVNAGEVAKYEIENGTNPASFPWGISYMNGFSETSALYLSDAANNPATTPTHLYWKNLGTDLIATIQGATVTVTIKAPYAIATATAKVTLVKL